MTILHFVATVQDCMFIFSAVVHLDDCKWMIDVSVARALLSTTNSLMDFNGQSGMELHCLLGSAIYLSGTLTCTHATLFEDRLRHSRCSKKNRETLVKLE